MPVWALGSFLLGGRAQDPGREGNSRFNARVGSGVFSTDIFNADDVEELTDKVSMPVWALGSFLRCKDSSSRCLAQHCFNPRVGSGVFSTGHSDPEWYLVL